VTVADQQAVTLSVRVRVVDSDKTFEVRDVFGPPGLRRPRFPRLPRGGFRRPPLRNPRGAPKATFKAKKLMCQVMITGGKKYWHQYYTAEPRGGTSRRSDDPATFQLNNQWMDFSRWLSTMHLPYYVNIGKTVTMLPGRSLLTPDGLKAAPAR
jgi:hypothetical protein